MPAIHRRLGNMTWKQKDRVWAIEKDGQLVYGGYTRFPGNIAHSDKDKPVWGSFENLEDCDYLEIID